MLLSHHQACSVAKCVVNLHMAHRLRNKQNNDPINWIRSYGFKHSDLERQESSSFEIELGGKRAVGDLVVGRTRGNRFKHSDLDKK